DILISLFAKKGSSLFEIALNGFKIFSIGFLLSGFNIFASGMFTAFSNGKISALLSLLRTFVFFVIGLLILPRFLGVNGVWLIVPFAELSTLVISIICIYKYRHTYMYTRL
ncbi:MAG: MATE family efflux transporter, partial [Zhenhengia sp.]